jgi:DNA-directed RNA polymerase subunit RPC12/RpoP
MSSPIENVQVICPNCGKTYQDWFRASVNLTLDNFDDEYIDKCSSAICPYCNFKVYFSSLVVDRNGTFCFRRQSPGKSDLKL